jgi:hypothetical protein
MVKKLFALASVTALTGLVAVTAASGCSSTTTPADNGTDAAQAGDTSKPVTPPKEAGPPDDGATPAAVCPPTTEITSAEIEMQIKWVAPTQVQNVCTQKNLDDLKALFTKGGGSAKFADIKTTLGAQCAGCAFSKKDAANWQVIVEDTNGFISNGTGSCFATVETPECGKAAFEFDVCLKTACNQTDCGMDAAAIKTCTQKAATGAACKGLNTAFGKACPNVQNDFLVCTGTVASIAVLCGGGPDAGLDSSVK